DFLERFFFFNFSSAVKIFAASGLVMILFSKSIRVCAWLPKMSYKTISKSSEIDERNSSVLSSNFPFNLDLYINLGIRMVIYSIDAFLIYVTGISRAEKTYFR